MCTRKKFTHLIQFNIFVFHILNGFLIFLNVHKIIRLVKILKYTKAKKCNLNFEFQALHKFGS